MKKLESFDLTYMTIDSLSEGVASSQITPLITRLSKAGLRVNLITFEKSQPNHDLLKQFHSLGITWNARPFGPNGLIAGVERLNILRREVPRTKVIHARSDIPAVSGILSHEAPLLWDVRSLWADQKILIQENRGNRALYRAYRKLEGFAARNSHAMSTLTHAVVPILESRNSGLPSLRSVVPTTVDLNKFVINPNVPVINHALFSGTYNDYYDLELSARFIKEMRKHADIEAHWARPMESGRSQLNVGESKIMRCLQTEMSQIIPNYSFGVSICKLNAGPSLTASMPTKIAEFLACGKPVVVNKGLGDMDILIEKNNIGISLDGTQGNLIESADKLMTLISDTETPQRCRAVAEKFFNMDTAANKYIYMYTKMEQGNITTP